MIHMNSPSNLRSVSIADFRSNTLTGVVQAEIERMIMSGELAPGQRLNEKLLADKLAVSRGPIREACRTLAELGLVYQIPNRGVFIKQLTRKDAVEVYDLRAGLIALASSILAPHVTVGIGSQMDALLQELEEAAERGDFARYGPVNLEFHDFIVRSTENGRLIKLYRSLVREFRLFRAHGLVQRDSLMQSNAEHRAMVDALKANDVAASYATSLHHINNGKSRMLLALGNLADVDVDNADAAGDTDAEEAMEG
jgi:DNA-binding GntR family transcriptional regulator